jgi:hypothetical protein
MLVGAAKEVSGIATHQRSRLVMAVQQRRVGSTALLGLVHDSRPGDAADFRIVRREQQSRDRDD